MDAGKLLEELSSVLKLAPDPFKVRVREILEELSSKSSEDLSVEGEILRLLARVVREQEEWIKREASLAVIGKIMALLKIRLDNRELIKELLSNWHPIVDLSQVTFFDVYLALSYLRGRKDYELEEREVQDLGRVELELSMDIGRVIGELEEELDELLKDGRVSYGDVVRGSGKVETLLRAFALSYLATTGKVTITYDPLGGEYYVERGAGEGEPQSLIVQLGRYMDAS